MPRPIEFKAVELDEVEADVETVGKPDKPYEPQVLRRANVKQNNNKEAEQSNWHLKEL